MTHHFSPAMQQLVAATRLTALDLGHDYISTLHFFLADGQLNKGQGVRDFAFETVKDFEKFYDAQRNGTPAAATGSIPLTVEAERALRQARRLWRRNPYRSPQMMPYHFFLAAVGSRKSTLHALLGGADGLVEKLERYYLETGQLQKAEVPPTVWARVWAYWRGRRSA